LSDGSTAPVTVIRAATPDGAPTADDLEVELTVPAPEGFFYLRVPEPSEGRFHLVAVRRSDGRELAVGVNAWTTDRTFVGLSQRPRLENRLHLFDYAGAGRYTLVYERDERTPDTTPPTSRMAALPPTSPAQIPLSGSGEDDPAGSGVATFAVLVSVDGGPFTRWIADTRNTTAIYPGAAGHRYAFYALARDAAGNREAAPSAPEAATFTVGNSAPVITAAPSVTVDEGQVAELQVTAEDADLPGDLLTFSLVSAPPGAQIDPATGRVTWVTGENDGPHTHELVVRVTDNGDPVLSSDRHFTITVRELNQPPTLAAPAVIPPAREGESWSLAVTATDPDRPPQPLRYRLGPGAPANLMLNPTTGRLTWIPDETLGGSTVEFDVTVRDGGQPEYTATVHLAVEVREVNQPPVLEPLPDREVWEGDLLSFTARAHDADLPADVLTFSLEPGAPDGAAIDPVSGEFGWVPVEAQVPGEHLITVRVTDDGAPPLAAQRSFVVTTRALQPGLNRPARFPNGDVSFRFKGRAGRRYLLQASTDLETWVDLREFVAEQAIFTLTDHTSAAFPLRFFRVQEIQTR
jgi:hypothetical protein